MRILVTGGGGFLGGGIVRRLAAEGHSVRSFSRNSYAELQALGVEQVRGDLVDPAAVLRACRDVELVYHVAAKAGIWGSRDEYLAANVKGTANVIRACREAGVKHLVFTSSPSVVFNGKDMEGADESVAYPESYKAFYPETKAAAERMVTAANGSDLATVSLRPHLIWGPRDTHLVPGILARGRSGGLKRIGQANHLVDFTYIDNAVEAHLCAGERLREGAPVAGRVYFISQDEPIPLWDFVNRVLGCAGLPPVRGSVPRWLAYTMGAVLEYAHRRLHLRGEPRTTRFLVEELSTAHWFDIGASRRDLGYRPQINMEEGFRRLAVYFAGDTMKFGINNRGS